MNHAIITKYGRKGWATDCGKRGWARVRFPGEEVAARCLMVTEFHTTSPDILPLAERWA